MIGPAQLIAQVQLPVLRPGLADALRPVLEMHGGSIEEGVGGCLVSFPPGTTRQRKFPFVETDRYDIRFPDGFLLLYLVGRDGRRNLCFDPRDLPEDVRERFA